MVAPEPAADQSGGSKEQPVPEPPNQDRFAGLEAVPQVKRLKKAKELGVGKQEPGSPCLQRQAPFPQPLAAAVQQGDQQSSKAQAGGGLVSAGEVGLELGKWEEPLLGAEAGNPSSAQTEDADEEDDENEDDDLQNSTEAANDTQCPECDDGGNLISCDGPCMRSFHFGYRKDEDDQGNEVEIWGQDEYGEPLCNPLAMPRDLAQLLIGSNQNDQFLCPNCLANRHQCYDCKQEGEAGREVTRCLAASCGKFYHSKCADVEPGAPIFCKLHMCGLCKQSGDSPQEEKGELVPCRRCPTAFHRHCLPSNLLLAPRDGRPQRVWLAELDEQGYVSDETEVNHSLMYCTRHSIRDNSVPHRRPLMERGLLQRWREHYAKKFSHLLSSQAILAALDQQTAAAAAAAAGEDSDLEDVPLAKRAKCVASFHRPPTFAAAPSPLASPAKRPRSAAEAAAAVIIAAAPTPTAAGAAAQELQAAGAAGALSPVNRTPVASPGRRSPVKLALTPGAGRGVAGLPDGTELDMAPTGDADSVHMSAAAAAGMLEGEVSAALEEVAPLPIVPVSAQEARTRVGAVLEEVKRQVTLDALRRETRQPAPYQGAVKKTIDTERLRALETSLQYAAAHCRLDPAKLASLVDRNSTLEVHRRHDDLMIVLAPYLHGDRYSSYGRHFTDPHLLEVIVDRMSVWLRDGDQVVDFSCGANHWVPLVKRKCLDQQGILVGGRAYDIILAKDLTDFHLKSWFDAYPHAESLAPPQHLVIGLNPPFGKDNVLANKFVLHAARFCPRLMVLIVPLGTVIPEGYQVLHEDRQLCRGEEFYVPGSMQASGAAHRSWNKVIPALRILVRRQDHWDSLNLHGEDWEEVPFARPMTPPAMALPLAGSGPMLGLPHEIVAMGGMPPFPNDAAGMAAAMGMPLAMQPFDFAPAGMHPGFGIPGAEPDLFHQQQQQHLGPMVRQEYPGPMVRQQPQQQAPLPQQHSNLPPGYDRPLWPDRGGRGDRGAHHQHHPSERDHHRSKRAPHGHGSLAGRVSPHKRRGGVRRGRR